MTEIQNPNQLDYLSYLRFDKLVKIQFSRLGVIPAGPVPDSIR
jgi:hypothetical protein